MKTNLYSVYDVVAAIFNKPFTEINDASAKRAFKQSLEGKPGKNDYELYNIGSYDDDNATLIPLSPEKIFTGFDIKTEE